MQFLHGLRDRERRAVIPPLRIVQAKEMCMLHPTCLCRLEASQRLDGWGNEGLERAQHVYLDK